MTSKMKLIVDANNLAYAAFISLRGLSVDELPTGVIYGFFLQVLKLAVEFQTNDFVFCWDSRKRFRRNIFSEYKNKRDEMTKEEKAQKQIAYDQFAALRKEILPSVGFENVFMKAGYEADDLIAYVVINPPRSLNREKYLVISTDNDMFQLLSYCDIPT